MNRISRELLSIAKQIKALDEEGDESGIQDASIGERFFNMAQPTFKHRRCA